MHGIELVAVLLLSLSPAEGGTDLPAPGDGSMGMVLVDGTLWVADRKEGVVFGVDPFSGAKKETLRLPCREPGGLAGTTGRLWCTEVLENLVYEVDPTTGKTVRRMESPCPYPGSAAWADGRLWVHCPFQRKISVTDPEDGTTVRWLPAPSKRVSALGSGAGLVFAADREKDRIYVLDPADASVAAVLAAGSPFVTGLAFDGRMLWTADYLSDRLARIDLDALPPFQVEQTRTECVTFRHHVVSGGPSPLTDLEVFVALPEDRPTQKVLSIDPVPEGTKPETVTDSGGQRFWKFRVDELPVGQEAAFGFLADVQVSQVRWFTDPRRKGTAADIPKEIRERYLGDASKYMITDPAVVETAKKLAGDGKAGERNLNRLFQQVYRYVLENMDYEISGGWNAAPMLLERKTGSCSEYTILLVSLLRAAGLPARYVGSVVMRGEEASVDLVFHRWAEVFLPGLGWIPVDANRGDTEWPADRADGFGFLEASFLITTTGGGDSDILGWGYNSTSRFKHSGPAQVREWTSAEWEPGAQ